MAEENKDGKPGQINIELSEEMAEGTYANLAIISHSNTEFVLDFIQVMPGAPKAKVKSRVLLTPPNAKRLMKALADNLQKYESVAGKIGDVDQGAAIPMNFSGPAGEA